jgi:CheY-like chemotaxis protein
VSLILVVDDMAAVREPIAASLVGAGYRTATAPNGAKALAAVNQEKPDLILLDVSMPIMDGLTFLGVLRGNRSTASIPVILLTAAADEPRVRDAAKLGVKAYLLKSEFSVAEMLKRVKQHLRETLPPSGSATPDAA